MGANDKHNHSARRTKYEPYHSKYGSDFEGTLYYEIPEEKTVKIYTVEFNYKKELGWQQQCKMQSCNLPNGGNK